LIFDRHGLIHEIWRHDLLSQIFYLAILGGCSSYGDIFATCPYCVMPHGLKKKGYTIGLLYAFMTKIGDFFLFI
jgi:hypothetical protein